MIMRYDTSLFSAARGESGVLLHETAQTHCLKLFDQGRVNKDRTVVWCNPGFGLIITRPFVHCPDHYFAQPPPYSPCVSFCYHCDCVHL